MNIGRCRGVQWNTLCERFGELNLCEERCWQQGPSTEAELDQQAPVWPWLGRHQSVQGTGSLSNKQERQRPVRR